jgi:hypothetical protein
MAIKIKTVAKGQPGVAGGGEKKYYVVPVMGGEWNIDKLPCGYIGLRMNTFLTRLRRKNCWSI